MFGNRRYADGLNLINPSPCNFFSSHVFPNLGAEIELHNRKISYFGTRRRVRVSRARCSRPASPLLPGPDAIRRSAFAPGSGSQAFASPAWPKKQRSPNSFAGIPPPTRHVGSQELSKSLGDMCELEVDGVRLASIVDTSLPVGQAQPLGKAN